MDERHDMVPKRTLTTIRTSGSMELTSTHTIMPPAGVAEAEGNYTVTTKTRALLLFNTKYKGEKLCLA